MNKGIIRPGHAQIRVLDMQKALQHYVELIGLIEMDRDAQGRVYLKGWTEMDKFSLVLREAAEPGLDFIGFKVLGEAALEQLTRDLHASGCEIQQVPAGELQGCGRRVRFLTPSGHWFELYAEKEYTGRWGVSDVNPEAWPRGLKGMRAERFDHALLYGPDLAKTNELFMRVLGFNQAERVIDDDGKAVASFLTVSTKIHDIAFIEHAEPGRLHHVSFLVNNWSELLRAADLISMTETSLDIGPTRHGITHGQTIYFFDPFGNRNEVFTGDDFYYPDHKPITWHAKDLGKGIFYHNRVLNERFLTVLT